MRRTTLVLMSMLGALLLAACGQTLPTTEEIVARMEAARAATNDAHAVVAIDFTSPERTGQIVVEGWMQKTGATDAAGEPIARVRAEVLEASDAEMVGSLVVSDGEQFWLYNPTENTVVTGDADEMKDQSPASPVGATEMLQDVISEGLDALDLEVVGVEQVAGKDAWKVNFTPKAETTAQLQLDGVINGTMWVDETLALPLKLTLDASDFGQGAAEVRSIETNTGLSADLFTFTPPADATIVDAAELADQMEPKAVTLDEARSAVSFALREPSYLPAGMALVEVRVIGSSTVILNYAGDGSSVSVVQSNEDVGQDREPPAGSQVQEVPVGDAVGTLITGADGEGALLRWEQDGVRFVVAGTLSADEALKVAEGLQ
jgi:outer membrane lipoprotein-sorting protein/predicted Fe-Mo cluster-binding NifX family protein